MKFPEDVMEEIMSRLQVVDLMRFKSVCKTWLSIISSPHFIQLHLKKSISSPSLRTTFMPYSGKSIKCNDFHGDVAIKEMPRPDDADIVLGSCDGLVCFSDSDENICIWNPATRISETTNIRTPSMAKILCYWFGRESTDDICDYKLVIGTISLDYENMGNHMHLVRPHFGNCNWKTTERLDKDYRFNQGMGTLLNGIVHWPAYVNDHHHLTSVVFSFDLCCETIKEIPVPEGLHSCFPIAIGMINGCLSAINFVVSERGKPMDVELWVMNEYGKNESWIKLAILLGFNRLPDWSFFHWVGVSDEGGHLIIKLRETELVLYNVAESKPKTLLSNACGVALSYFESLVSPKLSQRTSSHHPMLQHEV